MKKPILLVALAALVVAGAGLFIAMKFFGSSATAKAGECVVLSNQQIDRADVVGAGCDTDNAKYKVGKVLTDVNANCPEEADEYTSIVAKSGNKLCLLPNFVEGACYQPADEDDAWGKSACTGEETIKVTKVISGTSDTAGCKEGESLAFPEPPVAYCFAFLQP